MTNPTPEQIEAAAKAAHSAAMSHYPSMTQTFYGWDVMLERDREGFMLQARAALVAAAGVTPQESGEHFHIWSEVPCKPGRCRIAAPVQVDEAKLAEVVRNVIDRRPYEDETRRDIRGLEIAVARAVAEWFRGGGQ